MDSSSHSVKQLFFFLPGGLPHPGAPADEDEVVQSHDISPGDYVKVELDPEVFRAMHEGSEQAGWDDHMMEVSGLDLKLGGANLILQ